MDFKVPSANFASPFFCKIASSVVPFAIKILPALTICYSINESILGKDLRVISLARSFVKLPVFATFT